MLQQVNRRMPLASTALFLPLALSLVLAGLTAEAKNRVITVVNNCDYTVWPAIFKSVGPMPKQKTGWEAKPGSKVGFEVEESWGGRVWGRTGCDFTKDVPDYQQCDTGGCNGGLECDPDTGTGVLPVTLAEFNIQTDIDHYDTSNVDGFNIPMAVTNDADCPLSNCPYDLRKTCPDKLQYKNDAGEVVGCLTDCGAEQANEEYCCFGAHQLPADCPSSAIPNYPWWKKNCPIAYAYAYDESSGTALFTCTKQVNWMITFCPGPELYSSTANLPNGTEITQGGDYPDYPKGTAKDGGGAPSSPENESGSDAPASKSSSSGDGGGSKTSEGGASETGGGDSSPTSGGSGGSGSTSGGSGAGGESSPSKTGSTSTPTGSTGSGSGSGSGSDSDSDSDTSSGSSDELFGFPKQNVYIALGIVAVVLIGIVVYFAMKGKGDTSKKGKKHHHTEEDSDSEGGSSGGSRGGGDSSASTAGTDTDDYSSEDDRKSKKSSARALAKLDLLKKEEELAMRQAVYGDAARNPEGLTGLLLNEGGKDGVRRRRLFSMGKADSESSISGDGYSSEGSERAGERTRLARNSLAGV